MTELTDKQLKAIEDFLGGKDGSIIPDHFYEDVVYCEMFRDWLIGNDGQSALIDKLLSLGGVVNVSFDTDGFADIEHYKDTYSGRGENRGESLILAILDMLGAKTT